MKFGNLSGHDLRLSAFFIAQKMRKKAVSLNNFGEVMDPEDAEVIAKMIHQILELPNTKYKAVIDRLRNAQGVVNFVTDNEFAPLVELLLKKVFPPSSNAVFNMSMETPSRDYVMSAKDYFGDVPTGDANGNLVARGRLDQFINGTYVTRDKAWMQKMKLNEDGMRKVLGAPKGPQGEENPRWLAWQAYNNTLKEIDDYAKEMNNISVQFDRERRTGEKIPKEKRTELEERYTDFRALRRNKMEEADAAAAEQNLYVKDQNGQVLRRKNGFIHYDPISGINEAFSKLQSLLSQSNRPIRDTPEGPGVATLVDRLRTKMAEYATTDKVLIAKRDSVLQSLEDPANPGDPDHDPVKLEGAAKALRSKWDTFYRKYSDYINRANNHGKVVLMNDFEYSAFCVPTKTDAGQQAAFATDGGVLAGLRDHNDSNSERNRSSKSSPSARGNRALVIISDYPIERLPVSSRIEMGTTKIGSAEANIIISNLLEQVASEAMEIYALKHGSEVVETYTNKADKIKASNDLREMLEKQEKTLGRVDPDVVERMKHWIGGMTLRDAIWAVKEALAAGTVRKTADPEDPNGMVDSMEVNSKKVYESLRELVNAKKTTGVAALRSQDPTVKFSEYAYNKVGPWADAVKVIGANVEALHTEKSNILVCEEQVTRISDIMNKRQGLTAKEKTELIEIQRGYMVDADKSRHKRRSIMNAMAHMFILYGDPGVGKSIFADALADLLGYVIQNIDIGATKDKWLGNTEKMTRQLMGSMLEQHDTIFLIDEIDRQMSMSGSGEGGSQGAGQGAHEVTKSQVKEFLDLFELPANKNQFYNNNIFVIITTNFVGDIDTAFKARIADRYRILLPTDPEAYIKMVHSYMSVESRRAPDRPIYCDPKTLETGLRDKELHEQCWQDTFAMMKQVKWDEIAQVLIDKKISFREVQMMLTHALRANHNYHLTVGMVGQGKLDRPMGMPLTTSNMIAAASKIEEAKKSYNEINTGIPLAIEEKEELMEKLIGEKMLNLTQSEKRTKYIDEHGEVQERVDIVYGLDDNFQKFMRGELDLPTEQVGEFEAEEEEVIDPVTGKPRKRTRQLTEKAPEQKMKDMVKDQFKERPLAQPPVDTTPVTPEAQPLEKQEIKEGKPPQTKKEDKKDKKDRVEASSTDYYINRLISQGILNEKGEIVKQAKSPEQPKAKEVSAEEPIQEMVLEGDGFSDNIFNGGTWVIGPGHVGAKPQMPFTEIEKRKKTKKGKI